MSIKKKSLISVVVFFSLLIPFIGIDAYNFNLITYSLIWVILSLGLNIIQGYTGYVSIAQAAFFGIGAYSSAILSVKLDISPWITMPIGIIITAILAFLIGYPALRTKGHYFAIVTMSFGMIIYVLLVSWVDFTGGESGMPNIPSPEPLFGIDFSERHTFYYLILISTLLTILFVYRFIHSKTGRALITIRENEELAQSIGISLFKYKMIAFVVSAMLGGLAGVLYAHYTHFVNPTPFSIDYSLNVILAVILGGSGTLLGPIIGSFIMIFLPEYLRIADEYRLVIYGVMLILIMFYMPKGVINLISIAWENVRNKFKKA